MLITMEKVYGKVFYYFLNAINPIKKNIVDTPCSIHKFINVQALEILKNDKFLDAYDFLGDYITVINDGVVWADQDFKSSGHFYSPIKGRGLYGNNNALSLAVEYYKNCLRYWEYDDIYKSLFYLGAAVHLIQDVTIPQHANIRLLDNHRQYENFIRSNYTRYDEFIAVKGGYYLESIEEFISYNARNAININNRLRKIENENYRFYQITKFILPLAQKTTAGCFLKFYKDAFKKNTTP
jgi:phospholipase C